MFGLEEEDDEDEEEEKGCVEGVSFIGSCWKPIKESTIEGVTWSLGSSFVM